MKAASIGSVDSSSYGAVSQSTQSAEELIRAATDQKTGYVDTRQLAAAVNSVADPQSASELSGQIEAQLSQGSLLDAAHFSSDVAAGKALADTSNTGNVTPLASASGTALSNSVLSGAMAARPLPTIKNVPPTSLNFSQKDVKATTSDGMTLENLQKSMRKSWKGGPVDAVQWKDGTMTSIDNRRVLSAQNARLDGIPTQPHNESERLPATQQERFTLTKNIRQLDDGSLVVAGSKGVVRYSKDSLPRTWGEAAMFRAANQGNVNGQKFPLQGSPDQPCVRVPKEGVVPAAPQPDIKPPLRARATDLWESSKGSTVAGAAIGATMTAAQLALNGKLDAQHAADIGAGAAEGGALGLATTALEQKILTPAANLLLGGGAQQFTSQVVRNVASQGAADTAGVLARTIASRVAGSTAAGFVVTAGVSAWDNRAGLAHGDSHAIGNIAADVTVGSVSVGAATLTGAAIGSVVPVAGTAVGAAVGLAVGVGMTYGAQLSGARDGIANGVAHGVDAAKDLAKSASHEVSDVAGKVANFLGR